MCSETSISEMVKKQVETERARYRTQVLWATVFWCLPFLLSGTWIALQKLPPGVACAFHDNRFLLLLWPFNAIIYQQLEHLHFSASDQCLLIAGNSLFSTYFAVLALIAGWVGIRNARKSSPRVASAPKDSTIYWKLAMGVCISFGSTWMFSEFDDNFRGKGDFLVYRTYNHPGALVSKTLVWMIMDYVFIFVCLIAAHEIIQTLLAAPPAYRDDPSLAKKRTDPPLERDEQENTIHMIVGRDGDADLR